MELRLKIITALSMVEGAILVFIGTFADVIFPLKGWAHDPGFGWAGQGLLVMFGIYKIILGVLLLIDWRSVFTEY